MDDIGYRQRAIGDLLDSIIGRLGAGANRYRSEFVDRHRTGRPELEEVVSFFDIEIRDRVAASVREIFIARDFRDVTLAAKDRNGPTYRFSFEIAVNGSSNLLQAYDVMENTLRTIDGELERRTPGAKPQYTPQGGFI